MVAGTPRRSSRSRAPEMLVYASSKVTCRRRPLPSIASLASTGLEPAIEQAPHLTLEGRRPEGQGMAPAVGDGVVAKDERS